MSTPTIDNRVEVVFSFDTTGSIGRGRSFHY